MAEMVKKSSNGQKDSNINWCEPFLKDIDPAQVVYSESDGIIICADCRDVLPQLQPYNLAGGLWG